MTIFVPYFSYMVKIPVHCIDQCSIEYFICLICANKNYYINNILVIIKSYKFISIEEIIYLI